jgi:hypothetical protein
MEAAGAAALLLSKNPEQWFFKITDYAEELSVVTTFRGGRSGY